MRKYNKNTANLSEAEMIKEVLEMQDPIMRRIRENLEQITIMQKEFEKERKKTEKERRKTEKEIKQVTKLIKELQEAHKKTEEAQKKTEEAHKKTEEIQKKTEKEIDKIARDIGGGLGRAAEGLTTPSVPNVFKELGIKTEEVQQRVKVLQDGNVLAEIDLICPAKLNGKEIILVGEVKAHLTVDFVTEFLNDNLTNFKRYFPRYKNMDALGFVSGLYVDKTVAKFAQRQGLYVLAPSGETMHIINPIDFKPKIW